LFQRMRGRNVEFALLFKGFDYFLDSLIATILMFVPIILLLIPCYAVFAVGIISFAHAQQQGGGNPPGSPAIVGFVVVIGLLVLAVMVISMLIGVLFMFSYPLIVDRRLSGIEAVKLSFKASLANFWRMLGLILLTTLLGMVGVAVCYVGAFLVAPISFA